MEGRERAEYVNRRESCSANKRCIARRKSERKRQRKDGTGGSRGRREIGGRIGWDVQVRQYTKGSPEITIFHSFARSNYFVQLKYRFSPPSPRLSREFAFCSVAHSPSPPPPFRPFLSGHPPYGNIDRAQPRDSSPSHPRPSWYTATAFSLSLFLSVSLPPLLSLSFSVSTYAIPASIFNYWLRERSWTIRKKRETKSLTVSACTQTGACCFTALLRPPSDCATKRRETEERRENRKG